MYNTNTNQYIIQRDHFCRFEIDKGQMTRGGYDACQDCIQCTKSYLLQTKLICFCIQKKVPSPGFAKPPPPPQVILRT